MSTIIYGRNPVIEALENEEIELEKVYLVDGLKGEYELQIRTLCEQRNVPLSRAPHKRIDQLSKGGNHQGIVATIAPIEYTTLEELLPQLAEEKENPLLLVLDGITDVRNMGAIARSAKVYGVDAIVVPASGSAKVNNHMVKTSAGAILDIPICRENSLPIALEYLQQNDFIVMASDVRTEELLGDQDMTRSTAIVMGSEDQGISRKTSQISDIRFKIPQVTGFDSLNVSVATGIILYEAFKQRHK